MYACIGGGSRSAIKIFDDNLTAALHINILQYTMLPAAQRVFKRRRWCYLQDRDPKHTARATVAWLDEHVPEHLVDSWPANSPDLNPIENIWAELRCNVARRNPRSREELERAVTSSWREIAQPPIDNAMNSMPRRLRAVLAAKGGPTKY